MFAHSASGAAPGAPDDTMAAMDASVVHELFTDDGRALLASLPPYEEKNVVMLTTRLRAAGHSPELVAAALTQSRLRARAVDKFGDAAASMFFTPDALEQATRAPIARLHAQRFLDAGASLVIDGGCGIGSDAVGFAQAGLDVIGVEADPETAALAAQNLASFPGSRVVTGRVEDVAASLDQAGAAWWFDPARRTPGVADIRGRTKRTFSLAALTPTWDLIQHVAAAAPAAGAKLSPSLAHHDVPSGCEVEFVSYAGDVVEASVWWGAAVRDVGRTATIVRPRPGGSRSSGDRVPPDVLHVIEADFDGIDAAPASRASLGPYFYEADKALTRSGLVGALLDATGGHEFTPGHGYVTADALVDIGLLGRAYRVLDSVPLHEKTLRAYLRERAVGRLTIKKRDVDVDADALRRSLKLKGSNALTVVLVTLDGERLALVVEPL